MRTSWLAKAFLTTACCLALAGCSSTPLDSNGTVTPPALERAVPISFEGATSLGGCAFVMDTGACQVPNDAHMTLAQFGNGTAGTAVLHATGNITWTSTTPATDSLYALLVVQENGTWSWYQDFPIVLSASPMAFDWDIEAVLAAHNLTGAPVGIEVGEPNYQDTCSTLPVCAWGYAAAGQAFTVSGTATVRSSAA